MKKSYITILLLLMVMILGISAVSAADIDDTSDLTLTQDDSTPLEVEDTSDEVQTASDTEVIADSGEGNNFTSLKTLINEASSSLTLNKDYTRVDGDNDIEINKDFTIDGQDTYTIDANNLGGIFKVNTGYTLTLKGVTLTNGNSNYGGAVYVDNGATLNVENSKFNQNTAVYRGGAIYSEGTVDVKDSIFKYNDITHRTQNLDYGGAGIANIDGTLTVDNCEFSDNVKDYVVRGTDGKTGDLLDGAAILTSGDVKITNSDFFNNSACYGGAFTAIPITSRKTATITIDNCNFTDNLAYTGAAMYIGWNADYNYTISNSWFENNLAMGIGSTGYTAAGGAILSIYNSGSGSITKSTFKDNQVKDSTSTAGGAISIEDTSSVTIEECVFDGNTADYIGGAVEVASGGHGTSTVSIDKSNFTNNAAGYGGAVFSNSTTTLTVSNSLFEDNTATSGANSIYNMGDMTLTDNEFAADQDVFSTEIVLGTFTDLQDKINNAQSALDLAYDYAFVEGYDAAYANGVVIANPITINGNGYTISGSNAARIFNVTSGKLTLNDVTLTNGLSDYGGAIYVSADASLDTKDVELYNNTAVYRGGAIYSEGTVEISGSVIKENYISKRDGAGSENKGGSAIFNNGGTATLDNVKVIDNLKDYVNGDVLNGAVVAMGETTITNSYFANNYGRYGGAITQTETDKTLTVENTTFENNLAIFGAAIYDSGSTLIVKDSKFYNNDAVGPGSAGTSSSQGGAILVMGTHASADIKGSEFINNTADLGGAVSFADKVAGDFTIDDCEFTNNTSPDGGAIFSYITDSTLTLTNSEFNKNTATYGGAIESFGTLAVGNCSFTENTATESGGAIDMYDGELAVDNSDFTKNTATYGGAISSYVNTVVSNSEFNDNEAQPGSNAMYIWGSGTTLALTNNTIKGDGIQIYDYDSEITTPLNVKILDNGTVNAHMGPVTLKATVTDDNDNLILDYTFRFVVGDKVVDVVPTIDTAGLYTVTFTPTATGTFVVSSNVDDASEVLTGTLIVSRSLTDLANMIANVETGKTIVLDGDYTYIPEFDADLVNGIVIDKDVAIDGNGYTIDGNDLARIFDISSGTLALTDLTITNGAASEGAAVYIKSGAGLDANDVTFSDNVALDNGGAIYSDGGEINLENCVLDANDVTNLETSAAQNMGGAAIYAKNSQVTLVNTNVTNNGRSELDRSNGDLINAVINLINSDATITGGLFENNTGIYGGAIYAEGDGTQTLTVTGATFNNNKAYNGGAIDVYDGMITSISNSTFNNNLVVGPGSSGYYGAGGAIAGGETGSFTLTDSNFTANKATGEGAHGGAVDIGFSANNAASISGCEFTDNSATDMGNAIFNNGHISLSDNAIDDELGIYSKGVIDSQVFVIFMDNETHTFEAYDVVDVYAKVVDDSGNIIKSDLIKLITYNFASGSGATSFTFNETDNLYHAMVTPTRTGMGATASNPLKKQFATLTVLSQIMTVDPTDRILEVTYENITEGNPLTVSVKVSRAKDGELVSPTVIITIGNVTKSVSTKKGVGNVTFDGLTVGNYVINASIKGSSSYNPNEELLNLTVSPKKGTFTDLQYLIDNNEDETLVLPYDFTYDPDYDGNLIKGVVINKAITIDGNGYTIDGKETARILQLNANGITIDNVTFTNGYSDAASAKSADWGGAIYSNGAYTNHIISNSRFYNNTAYNGGAIYLAGDDSKIINSTFEGNLAFASGGAVFLYGWDCTIEGSNFTDNTANELGGAVAMYSSHPAIIRQSSFTKNGAGQNGGAVSWQRATGSIFESNFTENEAGANGGAVFWDANSGSVAGGEFTGNIANGFGGAIFVNENARLTIATTLTENAALNGGAIAAYGDTTVYSSTFTENSAQDFGGAVFVNDGAKLNIKQSTIKDNTATFGKSIYVLNGTVDSTIVRATILDNKTWDAALDDNYVLNATLTDDNGNDIYDPSFRFVVDDVVIDVKPSYNEQTGLYSLSYTVDSAGLNVVSTNYDAENLEVLTGILDVPKVEVTEFAVLAIDTLEGKNATVWLTLKANERGLNSPVTVIINNKEYLVNVKDGQGNITIEALPHGQYPVVAILDNPNYENAINSTVFNVKTATVVSIDQVEDVEYGDDVTITVHLTDNDGEELSGLVVLGYEETTIEVLVTNGVGTYTIDKNAQIAFNKGEQTFVAVYEGNNDYNASRSAEMTFNVNARQLTEYDVYVEFNCYAPDGVNVYLIAPDGTYNVTVDGQTVQVEVVDGEGYAEISGLTIGNKTATISVDDDNYELTPFTEEFEYFKDADFSADISKDTIKYGENATITISIAEDATGEVDVYTNGEYWYTFTVDELRQGVETPILDADFYEIRLSYNDDTYGQNDDVVYLNIVKATPSIKVNVTENPKVGDTVTVGVDVDMIGDGNVSIIVDGKEIYNGETDHEGLVSADVNFDLADGEHTVIVNFLEDKNYFANQTIDTFVVTKKDPTISIVVDDMDSLVAIASTKLTITVADGDAEGYIIIEGLDALLYEELTDGVYTLDPLVLLGGDYNITVTYLGDDKYAKASNNVEFRVVKGKTTPEITDVTTPINAGDDATFVVNIDPDSANGNVTVFVDGVENQVVILDSDYANATVTIKGLTNGTHTIGVRYNGNDNYMESQVITDTITVNKQEPAIMIVIEDIGDLHTMDSPLVTVTVAGGDATGKITINDYEGEFTLVNGVYTFQLTDLVPGKYNVTVNYLGDEKYESASDIVYYLVNKAEATPAIKDVTTHIIKGDDATFIVWMDPDMANGNVTVFVDDVYNQTVILDSDYANATVTIKGLTNGTHTIAVQYNGNDNFEASENVTTVIEVQNDAEDIFDVTNPENSTDTVFSVSLPKEATGYLLVDVNGEHYYAPVENGKASVKVPGLAPGNYSANITYTGDENHPAVSKSTTIAVPSNVADNALTIPETSETNSPTYSVKLPSDATGYLEVDVDGKKYVAPLVNGSASITVPGLSEGNHNVTVKYTGDSKYSSVSKNTTLNVHIPVYKITNNKNVAAIYSAKAYYKVLITKDGKAVGAGEKVTIKYNGKTYTVKTDSKGYATLKLNTKVKVKKYTITAEYKGVKVSNKVTIKHVIKASNKKAKKSKKLVLKVKTKKVNGKFLKGKKLKLKFRGKTYKAKISKKGVAKFTIKKKVMQKLKKGKKYKYTVTYGKDKVTKKITIK